jgi:sugar/nucleoside kinase (ribokinase family)
MPDIRPNTGPKTLSIGGATYDLFLTLRSQATKGELVLKAGEKMRVERVIETCGGGASNTSVGLARLGCAASFSGVLGSDQWGERLRETMMKEGVDVSSATIVENETSSFSIILSFADGERTILYTPGVGEHLHDTTFDKGKLETVDAVYLNHLSETSCMIEDVVASALGIVEDFHLTWNPGGCQIEVGMDHKDKQALLTRTTLLVFNKEEALAFTRTKSIAEAMDRCIGAGVKYVCITDGKNGTTATDGVKAYHCPVAEANVVDTTGAGDAFGTAATWALLSGLPLPQALKAGTLNAASVVGKIGAQAGLLRKEEMEKALASTTLTVSETLSR